MRPTLWRHLGFLADQPEQTLALSLATCYLSLHCISARVKFSAHNSTYVGQQGQGQSAPCSPKYLVHHPSQHPVLALPPRPQPASLSILAPWLICYDNAMSNAQCKHRHWTNQIFSKLRRSRNFFLKIFLHVYRIRLTSRQDAACKCHCLSIMSLYLINCQYIGVYNNDIPIWSKVTSKLLRRN